MWIFSELGFFSITRTPDGDNLHFRARKLADVENLKREFPQQFAGRRVMTLPHADYRYRIETSAVMASSVMSQLTKRIEYRNFKSHLAGTDQADKLQLLHALWHELHDYQTAQERPKKKKTAILRREAFRESEIERQVQGELSDYLAGFPNPDDEDDSLASLTEPFPDWDGPTNRQALDDDGWPEDESGDDDFSPVPPHHDEDGCPTI
jgi:hypothetical protein